MIGTETLTPWLRVLNSPREPRLRLICFPYAGAGPGVFREWAAEMPPAIELLGVHYPGREARAGERPLANLSRLIGEVRSVLRPRLDLPFAFFGHSMGAYVAYEVARRLDQQDGLRAEHLFLSGAPAPHLWGAKPLHQLPSREFLTEVIKLNGVPDEVLKSPEMLAYLLPVLRADFTACETHPFEDTTPMALPLTVFGGRSDPRATAEQLAAWSSYAGSSFHLEMFEGDHFFVNARRRELLRKLFSELTICLP